MATDDGFWKGALAGAGVIGAAWWLDARSAKRVAAHGATNSGALAFATLPFKVSPQIPKVAASAPAPTGKTPAWEGGLHPVSPVTLSEYVSGRTLNWKAAKDIRPLVEAVLGLPWATLVDPRAPVSLYRPDALIGRVKPPAITGATTREADLFLRAQKMTCNDWTRIVAQARPAWVALGLSTGRGGSAYAPAGAWAPTPPPSGAASLPSARVMELLAALNTQCAPVPSIEGGYWAPIGPMFNGAPKVTDACQGMRPNCWFVSYLASLAWVHPEIILAQSFRPRETAHDDALEFEFVNGDIGAVERVRMDNTVPCISTGQYNDPAAPFSVVQPFCHSLNGVAWPALFEKARAVWEYGVDRPDAFTRRSVELGSGWTLSIEMLNHGDLDVYGGRREDEVGLRAGLDHVAPSGRTRFVTRSGTTDDLDEWARIVGEYGSDLGVVAGHAYSVLGQIKTDGRVFVVLRNPWGYQGASHPTLTLPDGTRWIDGLVLGQDGVFALDLSAFVRLFTGLHYADTAPWFPALG